MSLKKSPAYLHRPPGQNLIMQIYKIVAPVGVPVVALLPSNIYGGPRDNYILLQFSDYITAIRILSQLYKLMYGVSILINVYTLIDTE